MIPNEEALNRDESSFAGETDVTSIINTLYSSLYQFAVSLTKTESDDFPTEDPEVWRSLDARSVREALLQVDEKYRVALELFYLNNISYREIAAVLGIPIGTVMSRLSGGKAQLKSILWEKL